MRGAFAKIPLLLALLATFSGSAAAEESGRLKPGQWATTSLPIPLLERPGGKGLITLPKGSVIRVDSIIGSKAYLVTVVSGPGARGLTGVLPAYSVRAALPALPAKLAAEVGSYGTGYWDFQLRAGRLIAVAAAGASYDTLAGGKYGSGPAPLHTTVDVTDAFPSWVAEALAKQRDSGLVLTQNDPRLPPEAGYHAYHYELGYGNCHGFSFHVVDLYPNLPIEAWTDGSTKTNSSAAIAGAPPFLGHVDSTYRVVNVLTVKDQHNTPPSTLGYLERFSEQGGKKWATVLTVGRAQVMKQIRARGGTPTAEPRFGDLCFVRGDIDHSLIVLGAVGGQVYSLQKMSPMNPYYVRMQPATELECFRVPH